MRVLYEVVIGPEVTKQGLEELGRRLAGAMGREHAYSYRYMRSLIKRDRGFEKPSKRLHRAMEKLLREHTPVDPRLTSVTAIGKVAPGSLILADSKECALPTCKVNFVGRAWNSKYCCDDHKRAARRLERKK